MTRALAFLCAAQAFIGIFLGYGVGELEVLALVAIALGVLDVPHRFRLNGRTITEDLAYIRQGYRDWKKNRAQARRKRIWSRV